MKISELNKLQLGSIVYFNNDSYNYILVGYSNTTVYFASFVAITEDVIPLIGKQIMYKYVQGFSLYELLDEKCFLSKNKKMDLSIPMLKFQMLYGKNITISLLKPDMKLIDALSLCTLDNLQPLHMYLVVQNGSFFSYLGKYLYVDHTFVETRPNSYRINKDYLYKDFGFIWHGKEYTNDIYGHYVKIGDQYGIYLKDKIGVIGTTIKKDISDIFKIKDFVKTDAFTERMVEHYDKELLDYIWGNKNEYRGI